MERIVGNLLTFARQGHKQPDTTDLNRLLDEVLDQLGHQVPMTGISAKKNYAEGIPPLYADADQLRQVFTNLFLNAVQAMAGSGVLSIATRRLRGSGTGDQGPVKDRVTGPRSPVPGDGDLVEISVTDTGKGITPESLSQLFNPFFTTRADGTGLGLSVSYGIVKEHGGTIEVESQPGNGATFRVILPISRESDRSRLPA